MELVAGLAFCLTGEGQPPAQRRRHHPAWGASGGQPQGLAASSGSADRDFVRAGRGALVRRDRIGLRLQSCAEGR
jgi:hypothetical protein